MTNPFERFRTSPPPPPPSAPRAAATGTATPARNPFEGMARNSPPAPPRPFRQARRMRPPEERMNDPQLSAAERQRAANAAARPTQASRDIPARQEHVRTTNEDDGSIGDVAASLMSVLRRAVFFDTTPMSESERQSLARAARFSVAANQADQSVPEFGGEAAPEQENVRYEGGPLSGALNAMPDDTRRWLDARGREMRLGVGFFLNADEDDRAVMIQNNIPTAEFRRDENGALQTRLTPESPWAYINRPGYSTQDGVDFISLMARYYPSAQLSAAPRLLASRAAVGGATAAGTDWVSQELDDFVGGPEGVDAGRVAESGLYGAGGQVLFDTAAAAYQVAKPHLRRVGFGFAESPSLPPPAGSQQTAADAYEEAAGRDYGAERAAIDERAAADRDRLSPLYERAEGPAAVNDLPDAPVWDPDAPAPAPQGAVPMARASDPPPRQRLSLSRSPDGNWQVVDETGTRQSDRVFADRTQAEVARQAMEARMPGVGSAETAPPSSNPNAAEDFQWRTRRVEQERRAAHARLDNEEFGLDIRPPGEIHDAAREAMARGTPVYVTTPSGVRRVQSVRDEGFIDEAGDYQPSAGLVGDMTDDGLLFSAPPKPEPRPRSSQPQQPPQPQRTPTAGELYAASDEFGVPISRGEAAQDVAARTREYDMLHGTHGPGAERRAAGFQDQRADAIQRAGQNIATRNQDPLAQNLDDAGQIVQNQVRERYATLTQEINAAYKEAMTGLAEIPVGRDAAEGMWDAVTRRLRYGNGNLDDAGETLIPVTGYDPDVVLGVTKSRPGNALRMIRDLQYEIVERAASPVQSQVRFSHVERIRQRLLEMQDDAVAANDPDRYALDLIVKGFDEWLAPALQRPPRVRITSEAAAFNYGEQQALRQQAEQAIRRARSLHAQREELFGRNGAGDLGGRTMEQIRQLDTTGTQIINQIFGAGRIPRSEARAAVQRITDIANRSTPQGAIVPKGERTTALGRFEGGTAHPAPEIQALREALFMRILEPLRTRGQGTQVPIQTIVNNLDTAINGQGRSITRVMFTESEVQQIEKFLNLLRHYTPTTGSRPTGVTAARMIGTAVDGLTRFIQGTPGYLLRGVVGIFSPGVREASGEVAARQAFSRPMLPDGLPPTTSGAAYGQLMHDNSAGPEGVEVPLDVPPSTAAMAYEAPIDMSRPIISGDNGEFSTERTVTIEVDGRFYNIPTIVNGHQISVSNAIMLWEEGSNAAVGEYSTEAEAISAAQERSRRIGDLRGQEAAEVYQ